MVAEFGGAQREACVGGRGRHERVRRGRGREGGLELVWVVGVARLMVRVDGWGGQEPVGSRVSRVVRGDAQGDLVYEGASLRVRETVAVLEERGGRGAGRQDGVGVVVASEVGAGGVGQQGVGGQALGVGGGGRVRGAAVVQVSEGVHSGRDEGVRPQRPIVAVPLFVAQVCAVGLRKRMTHKTHTHHY